MVWAQEAACLKLYRTVLMTVYSHLIAAGLSCLDVNEEERCKIVSWNCAFLTLIHVLSHIFTES